MTQPFTRVSDLTDVAKQEPTFLAIGIFDGVHLGHQKLLQSMVAAAREAGARPAALTFFPHPGTIIGGQKGRLYLCTLEERVALLADQGLELVITHRFDEEVRRTRAADFVDRLCRHLDLSTLWGGSFGLGYNREGTLPFLQELGRQRGFDVHLFDGLVEWRGELVSSSRVRRGLASGDMEEVSGCLGRPYRLTGRVIPGDGRGRTIGIPTANLSIWDEQLLPATGVYATVAWVDDHPHASATNIGVRPTVNGHSLWVETHLLDFDADLYDRQVALDFVARIRDERKFPSLDALVAQIRTDIGQIRELLGEEVRSA